MHIHTLSLPCRFPLTCLPPVCYPLCASFLKLLLVFAHVESTSVMCNTVCLRVCMHLLVCTVCVSLHVRAHLQNVCIHILACVCLCVHLCVVSMCSLRGETRSCICGGANLHHSCSDMYVLGQGGVKGVSEHLEDFLHGFGMFCSRTPSCSQSCLLE